MNLPETDLLGFISAEEQNLLVSLLKCHRDIALAFPKLDGTYQAPIQHIEVNIHDEHRRTILALYLFTHYHLYLSTVMLLRCHLSDSLASTRKAIDASLTAYRLIAEPDTLEEYESQHRNYQFIKGYIERKRKQDPAQFPLAESLIEIHNKCSEYGSHADISSFVHRITIENTENADKGIYKVGMFQIMNDTEARHHMVMTFLAFTLMLKIYQDFLGDLAQGLDRAAWMSAIDELQAAIYTEGTQIEANLKSAD